MRRWFARREREKFLIWMLMVLGSNAKMVKDGQDAKMQRCKDGQEETERNV